MLQVIVEFDILYSAPNESIASFADSQAYAALDDEQQMLIDIEQNIANLERTLSNSAATATASSATQENTNKEKIARFLKRNSSQDKSPGGASVNTPDKTEQQRKRSSTLKTVRNLMRIGKQRPSKDTDDDDDENASLIKATDGGGGGRDSKYHSESESAPLSRACSQSSLSSNADSQASVNVAEKGRKSRLILLYI